MWGSRTRVAFATTVLAVTTACGQPDLAEPTTGSLLGPANPATGSPVRVGVFNLEDNPLIDLSSTGDAAEAAAAYANDHLGGLDGHPIDVVRCADKLDAEATETCGDVFVQAGVVAVVAGQPATAEAIVPTVVAAGIPWIGSSPLSLPEIVATEDAFFFGSGAAGSLGAYAQYSADVGYRKVVIYAVQVPEVISLVQNLGAAIFAEAGIEVRIVGVPPGGGDATQAIHEGLVDGPDAVLVVGERTACQSVLAALHTLGSTAPKLVGQGCVDNGVIGALGESAIDNVVVFGAGDPSGDHHEAQVYRAVMQRYTPGAEPSGLTSVGYVSMLGLVRAVNAGGLPDGDRVTGEQVMALMRAAKDVPRPLGNSGTFSCDRNHLAPQVIKATMCTSEVLYSTYTGGIPGRYDKIDIAAILGGTVS